MEQPSIHPRAIVELLPNTYYIPSYQRGYRWTSEQVTDLLEDLWEFQSNSDQMSKEEFYCLQPLVVQLREDGQYEVIDGQQRLTTIYLILTALKLYVEEEDEEIFSLEFQSRQSTSGEFLCNLDESRREENIDFYHIYEAYITIQEWFKNKKGSKGVMAQLLLRGEEAGRNVKVIWYELPASEDVIDVFTRLNIGKIPLTNSELIRALFLRTRNFGPNIQEVQQIRIAQEWDHIERNLQRDDFWYFIHSGSNTPENHIEYLFDLQMKEADSELTRSGDAYRCFHFFNQLFKENHRQEDEAKADHDFAIKLWSETKKFYLMLDEWFQDRDLYHLTGFLIHLGVPIPELRNEARNLPKSSFDTYLRNRIFLELFGTYEIEEGGLTLREHIADKLGDMNYHSSKAKLRSILLLFNIATLFENERSNLRFPFDSFKREKWDIEHISSVDGSKPDKANLQKEWLEKARDHYAAIHEVEDLPQKIDEILASDPFDKEGFDQAYEQILELSGEKDSSEADDQLENLTLLDQGTNRSYKNAVFPVKRNRILGLDRSGTFVPLCTRNIFLKCYSNKLDDMFRWNGDDKHDYREHTIATLTAFFQSAITH